MFWVGKESVFVNIKGGLHEEEEGEGEGEVPGGNQEASFKNLKNNNKIWIKKSTCNVEKDKEVCF